MKKRFAEEKIIDVLEGAGAGQKPVELCHKPERDRRLNAWGTAVHCGSFLHRH